MPYTMVGSAGLGFDLARRPAGAQVATVVRTALACDARDLVRLAARARRAGAGPLPERPQDPDRVVDSLGVAGRALSLAEDGQVQESAAVLRRLELATLGDVASLDRFVRSEVLDWALRDENGVRPGVVADAADVLCDAAAAGFGEGVAPAQRRRLCAGFVGARLAVRDEHVGTGHAAVDRFLAELCAGDETVRRSWRAAADRVRPQTTSWAPAFHQATWAAHLSDRLRLAMDVQLAGVQAFHAAGFEARDAAYGVWNALSGTLQGLLMADLLAAEHLEVLMAAQHAVTSPA